MPFHDRTSGSTGLVRSVEPQNVLVNFTVVVDDELKRMILSSTNFQTHLAKLDKYTSQLRSVNAAKSFSGCTCFIRNCITPTINTSTNSDSSTDIGQWSTIGLLCLAVTVILILVLKNRSGKKKESHNNTNTITINAAIPNHFSVTPVM